MSEKSGSEGRIQWSRFFKKFISIYDPEGTFISAALWPERNSGSGSMSGLSRRRFPYGPWYEAYAPDQTVLDKQRKKKFVYAPLISVVVPAYRTPQLFLKQMIDSLIAQTYENWELCIANGSPEEES